MEYITIADLDGCPEDNCPLYDWCPAFRSHPSEFGPGCCADYPPDYLIEDAVAEVAGQEAARAEYYTQKWREEDALKAKKAGIQAKRRATLAKNRNKNKERARLRARKRLALNMGVTERAVDLMGELVSIRNLISRLAQLGQSLPSGTMDRVHKIESELEEERKKCVLGQAEQLVKEMLA